MYFESIIVYRSTLRALFEGLKHPHLGVLSRYFVKANVLAPSLHIESTDSMICATFFNGVIFECKLIVLQLMFCNP